MIGVCQYWDVASITKRGSAYRVQIRRRGHRPVVKSFRTKALAERWAREWEHKLEVSGLPSEADLGDLIGRYNREVYQAQPRPKAGIKHYERLERDLAGVRVADLTAGWWLTWARGLNVKPSSRTRYVTEIVGALRVAEALWGVQVPWAAIRAGREVLARQGLVGPGRRRTRRLTPAEVEKIKAETGRQTFPMADIIDFALLTALRLSEITRVAWADLDREKRMLLVRDRKHPRHKFGNHTRLPLLGNALEIIERQPAGDGAIFPYNPMSIADAFERAARRAGLPGVTFHVLRHEATSRLFDAGYAIQEVALVTGHNDWKSLRIYTHIDPEELHDGPAAKRKAG